MPSWPMESAKLFQAMPNVGRLAPIIPWCNRMAGEVGFEPTLPDPESGVLPLDYSPKSIRIGQKIQSLLSNPFNYQTETAQAKYHPSSKAGLYNGPTDNGKETIPLAAPPTLREAITTIARSADVTDAIMAPPTLPESDTEVASC